jgi:hypothetical protein
VFIPKTVGLSGNENFINSDDADYVMGRIRRPVDAPIPRGNARFSVLGPA